MRYEVECYHHSFIYNVLLVAAAAAAAAASAAYPRNHAGGEDVLLLPVSGMAPSWALGIL
jgi:hypothetical protein